MNDSNPTTYRVLLVDDNQSIHEDFHKILAASEDTAGALNDLEASLFDERPSAAASNVRLEFDDAFQGEEALAKVKQAKAEGRPYSMAFVDVRMPPGWDGIVTTEQLWEVDPDVQIVICTAFSDYSWEEMLGKLGQSDRLLVLKKPFEAVEALQLANALVVKWQALQVHKRRLADLESSVVERTRTLQTAIEQIRQRNPETPARQLASLSRPLFNLELQVNRRLLVVDDNRAIHDDYRKILCGQDSLGGALARIEASMFGFSTRSAKTVPFAVDSAYSGQEGVQAAERAAKAGLPYAAVFLDVRMPPGMDGVQTAKCLWNISPDLQIVICTAFSDYSWDELMENLGRSDRFLVLKKPFENIEVAQMAATLTAKWHVLQQTQFLSKSMAELVALRTLELETALADYGRLTGGNLKELLAQSGSDSASF